MIDVHFDLLVQILIRTHWAFQIRKFERSTKPSSLLKNLEMESFLILAGRCRGGAVELDVIF